MVGYVMCYNICLFPAKRRIAPIIHGLIAEVQVYLTKLSVSRI